MAGGEKGQSAPTWKMPPPPLPLGAKIWRLAARRHWEPGGLLPGALCSADLAPGEDATVSRWWGASRQHREWKMAGGMVSSSSPAPLPSSSPPSSSSAATYRDPLLGNRLPPACRRDGKLELRLCSCGAGASAELEPHMGRNSAPLPADDEAGALRLAPPPHRLRVQPLRPRVHRRCPLCPVGFTPSFARRHPPLDPAALPPTRR
uniref:Uncharacterized protein n=1 Tax=Oryza sativa subsp. japonica TaxID=39947 RepID=Q84NN2_ORYSJ|nr:uncharacterized protein LOC112939678 [Oryza sativa Japonica Group]BAC75583.1 hypothetical protein [Oryza sativa Japonica Group]